MSKLEWKGTYDMYLFHHDFIQVQAKYNTHRRRPGPSSHSRQMAGQVAEYEP